MKKRSLALLLVLVMSMSMALSACGGSKKDSSKESGTDKTGTTTEATTLSVILGPEPDTIDPNLNSAADAGMMIEHAFGGLTKLESDAITYGPGDAESWEISEDGLTYTFHLRDGLKWSDGSPLTANDYVYSWNRLVNPDTAADYSYLCDIIEGYDEAKLNVVATDDKTLTVTLKAMCPYFLELVAFTTFYPVKQDVIESAGESWTLDPATYVGNGPYKLKEWAHDSYVLMEKNENYWDAANVKSQEIKFVLMSDPSSQLAAYESGEVSFIDDIPTSEIAAQKEQADFHMDNQLSVAYVQYNTQNEYLSNPLLRKALTLAVDRTYICEQIGQAGQQPTSAFVPTGLSDADPTQDFRTVGGEYYNATDYEGNVELAKQALEEAGYPNGEGLPTFNYLTNEGGTNVDIAEALQDMWSKIGVNVNIDVQEWNTMLVSRKDGQFDITRGGWGADYNDPITFLDMYITGGGNNDPQWSNKDYDALIKKAKTTSDSAERMQYMHDAEDIIMGEWVLCPLFNTVDLYKISDKLQGVYVSKLGHKHFQYATVTE